MQSPFIHIQATLAVTKNRIEDFQTSKNSGSLKEQLEKARALLTETIEDNKTTTQKLADSVTEQLSSKNLSKLTNSTPILEELFQFLEKLIQPLYKLLKGDEKLSKPGFFSSKAEKNLQSFSKEILPDIEAIKEQQQNAAPAA